MTNVEKESTDPTETWGYYLSLQPGDERDAVGEGWLDAGLLGKISFQDPSSIQRLHQSLDTFNKALLESPEDMHSKEKSRILASDYLPLVKLLTNDDPETLVDWPLKARPVDQNRPNITPPSRKTTKPVDQNRPKSRSIWTWLSIPIVLLLVGALYVAYLLGSKNSPQIPMPTAISPVSANTPVDTPQPSSAPTENTVAPAISPTLAPSDAPPPADTHTPSPLPTAESAFSDAFENGLNPAWTVVFGNPIISNGQLQVGESTLISVGDTAWSDYQVDFEVTMIRDCSHDPSFVGVRSSDRDNMLLFEFDPCDSEWNSVVNGNWTPIPGTRLGNQGFVEKRVHFTVLAKGSQIVLHAGANKLNSFTDPDDHLSGNIYLRIKPGDVVDNFKVTFFDK